MNRKTKGLDSILRHWIPLVLATTVYAQGPAESTEPKPKTGASEPAPSSLPKPVLPPRDELEKKFAQTLTGAVLQGTWSMTGEGGLTGKVPLTDPKPDRYTITKATKSHEDYWVIQARIQYGDKDVTVPVPVRVVWAEDTPIITLNDLPIPGIGSYSARVMVFADFYCGTWFSTAKNYGGVLSGRVLRESESQPPNRSEKKE